MVTAVAPTNAAYAALSSALRVEPLPCAIGAEVTTVDLAFATHDPELMEGIRSLLLRHMVLSDFIPSQLNTVNIAAAPSGLAAQSLTFSATTPERPLP